MERRRFRRIIVLLAAEIISRTDSYSGFLEIPTEFNGVSFYTFAGTIENMSEDGMMITVPETTKINFTTGSTIEVGFHIHSEERLNLHCEVKWSKTKTSRYGVSQCIGMAIITPPPLYNKFLKNRLDQTQ